MKPPILFLSYDGMLEPLGQSQVLSYLERLTADYRIHLVSFEKEADCADWTLKARISQRIDQAGIVWAPLRYHKRPTAPATAYDILAGTICAAALMIRHRIKVVHARSYVPGLMALQLKRLLGSKFIFDMRGFWADERVDGNLWPKEGALYRSAKRVEKALLVHADHIVTLTHASSKIIEELPYLSGSTPPLSVIPTCADLALFRPQAPAPPPGFVLGHIGSVGTWYLFDELLAVFEALVRRRPDAQLLIITRDDHDSVWARVARTGIMLGSVEVTAADHRDMPAMIARMTVGAAIIKPAFSKIASAPTKLAEYLGCGIPCLGNAGVGDMEEILEGDGVGVALTGFSPEHIEAAVDRLLLLTSDPTLGERCREVAARRFTVDAGVAAYRRIYEQVLAA